MNFLEQIKTSNDIKKFTRDELRHLAFDIRKRIIDVVSKNGGHLASSLGAVELTLAIHYVFDLPLDTVIWDVGHQSYAHKILTGRNDKFDKLRLYKGLSGFSSRKESLYDVFSTGHSSTAISAGLGICCAKELNHEKSQVISIVGDGSLTAGLAYEGLNHAGDLNLNMIVILNDNDMSISKNVGALSSFLSRTLSAKHMQNLRNKFGAFLKSLPKIGDEMYNLGKRSEESFKTFVTPGMLFEAFNFDYFGPIDGHNIDHLIDILTNIKSMEDSVFLHIITKKGKGYEPAEQKPVLFHGIGSFNIDTGKSLSAKSPILNYTQVFGSQIVKLAKENEKIVAITAAMPEGTGLTTFAELYEKRFFDVGIAEQHAVTFAAGLASKGFKPVVAIYSTFLQRAFDQLLHDVCLDSYPVVFAIDRGGIVGEDGPTHHGLFDYSYLRCMPNMTIMAPMDENELARMLVTAVNHNSPIAIRYPRGKGLGVKIDDNPQPITIGKAKLIFKGDDVLLLAIGSSTNDACKARKILKTMNIDASVINARFVKPLDKDLILEYATKIKKIITIEEHVLQGGFGSAVLEMLADNKLIDVVVERIGIKNKFVEYGNSEILKKEYKIDVDTIVQKALELNS